MLLCLATPLLAQEGGRGEAEVMIKGKKISVDYGRPDLNGRDIFSLAPTGTVWRLGKDKATKLVTTGDLMVGGKALPAGQYSLWAKKTGDSSWVLEFHPKADVWGAPALTAGYVAEVPMKFEKVGDSAEMLTIALAENKGKGWIKVHWGNGMLSAPFDVK